MTRPLQIRRTKMHFWKGSFSPPNVILLRAGMGYEEERKTLVHELLHHDFYIKHKWSRLFFHFRSRLVFTILAFLILPFSPFVYFLLIIPLLLLNLHEVHVSAVTCCWKRMLETMFIFSLLIVLGAVML